MRPIGTKNFEYTSPQGYTYKCNRKDLLYIPRSKAEALKMLIELTKPMVRECLSREDDDRVRSLKWMLYTELIKKITK